MNTSPDAHDIWLSKAHRIWKNQVTRKNLTGLIYTFRPDLFCRFCDISALFRSISDFYPIYSVVFISYVIINWSRRSTSFNEDQFGKFALFPSASKSLESDFKNNHLERERRRGRPSHLNKQHAVLDSTIEYVCRRKLPSPTLAGLLVLLLSSDWESREESAHGQGSQRSHQRVTDTSQRIIWC